MRIAGHYRKWRSPPESGSGLHLIFHQATEAKKGTGNREDKTDA